MSRNAKASVFPIRLSAALLPLLLGALASGQALALDINVRGGAHDDFNRLVFDWPRAPAYKLTRADGRVTITFSGPATGFKLDGSARKLTRLGGFAVAQQADATAVSFSIAPQATVKDFLSGTSLVIDVKGAPVGPGLGSAIGQVPPAASASADTPAVATPVAPLPEAAAKDLPAPIPALLFERGTRSYALTDSRAKIAGGDAAPLANVNGWTRPLGEPPQPLGFVGDSAGTLRAAAGALADTVAPAAALAVEAQPDYTLGGRLLVHLQQAGAVLAFVDPATGETLFGVPTTGGAVPSLRRYRDFELLPTRQGLLVRPLNEKLAVRAVKDGIEIAVPAGLPLSPAALVGAAAVAQTEAPVEASLPDAVTQAAEAAGKEGKGANGGKGAEAAVLFLPLADYQPQANESFTVARQHWQNAVAAAPEDGRAKARLDLARFYLANGYGQEAAGLLKDVAMDTPDVAGRPEFRALRGMAAVVRGDADGLAGANADLSLPELSQYPDLTLWQAVGLAEQHNYTAAAPLFTQSLDTLAGYPEPFFTRFTRLAAESLLAAGDNKGAASVVQLVETRGGKAAVATSSMQYIRGVIESRIGSLDQARQLWEAAAQGQDMLARTRAKMALIDLGLAAKTLSPAEAAQQLEGLRYGWRGDSLELELLQRLAGAYAASGQPDEALGALERAKRIQNDKDSLAAIDKQERQIFADLFTGPAIDKYQPLKALAAYNRYKQFAPLDPQVAQAINAKLVDKMLSIDLLGQAADLLEQRLAQATDPAENGKLGARVAGIRLLNGEAPKALQDLDASEAPGLAADTAEERKLLRARALAEASGYGTQARADGKAGQNGVAPALALLKDDPAADARRLDATIAWRARDWAEAARALNNLVPPAKELPPQNPAGKLTDEQAQFVMRRAVALTLAGDSAGIAQLSADYGAAMQPTAQADSFALMTAPEGAVKGIATLPAELKDVDLFRTFLESYRK